MKGYKWFASLIILPIVMVQWAAAQDKEKPSIYVSSVDWGIQTVQKAEKGERLQKVLSLIEKEYNVNFLYSSGLLTNKKFSKPVLLDFDRKIYDLLDILLGEFNFTYKKLNHRTLGIVKKQMERQMKKEVQETVKGVVTDAESGETLPGVNILVKGTTTGTSTDANGEYELTVESLQDTLVFSFVGYQTREVAINGRTEINVALQSKAISGQKVVVTGYSTQRKMDLTGSVDVAEIENIQRLGSIQVSEGLQGQISGVSLNTSGQPGDQPQITIRGFNTFGNNQPLFVVDGVPTQDISFLNSYNIETMQVLKDAGAASQYGARASNGVIVISTKQGSGDTNISYNSSFGYQMPGPDNPYNILSPQEQGQLEWMARRNSGKKLDHPIWGNESEPDVPTWILPARAKNPNTDEYYVLPYYKDANKLNQFQQFVRANKDGTDWYDALTDPAPQLKQNINIGGGGDYGSYFASFSYVNQQGMVINTSLKRYSARVNTEFNISDNVRIGENLVYDVSSNLQAGTLTGRNALGFVYNMHTIIPVRDIRRNFAGTQVPGLGTAQNPVALRVRARNNDQQTRRLFGNAFAEIDFLNNFTFRTNFGIDLHSGFLETFQFPTYEQSQNNTTNSYSRQTQSAENWSWTNQVNYNNTFGNFHNVSAVVAVEAIRNESTFNKVTRTDYFSFDKDYVQLATGSGTPSIDRTTEFANSLLSFIMNVDYDFKSTYLLGLTLRRDGSSKFLNDKWRWFPAVSAGWRVSELSFLQDITWLTNLKIRGSYGVMGNQLNVNPNNGFTLYGGSPQTTYYPISGGNSIRQGLRQVGIGNPDAQWERNRSLNIGLDFSLFDGNFGGSVDAYRKNIEGLLFNPALPATAGAAAPPTRNVASMRNQGFDVSLRGQTKIVGNLRFNGQLNFTSYNNEINAIAPGIGKFDVGVVRNEVGYPISSYFGYDIIGFWQRKSEVQQANQNVPDGTYQQGAAVGRFRYRDVNGDNQITPDDRVHLGSPHPDFSYGLNMQFTYRNWYLSAFIYGEEGKELWNQTKQGTDFRGTFNTATSKVTLYDSWSPKNRDAEAPIQEITQSFSTSGANSSYFVENASFLKLKSLQLGYTFPPSLLQQAGINNLRIYLRARNLFTITPYSGLNPDIGATQSAVNAAEATGGRVQTGATNFGVDRGGYPVPRIFEGGFSISL